MDEALEAIRLMYLSGGDDLIDSLQTILDEINAMLSELEGD